MKTKFYVTVTAVHHLHADLVVEAETEDEAVRIAAEDAHAGLVAWAASDIEDIDAYVEDIADPADDPHGDAE